MEIWMKKIFPTKMILLSEFFSACLQAIFKRASKELVNLVESEE